MTVSKNPVKAQWRPASQPRKERPLINQLPDACRLDEGNSRRISRSLRALTECDASFKRSLPNY